MTFLRACYIWIRFDANSPPRASPKNFNKKGKKIILAFSTPTIDYLGIRRTTSVSDGLPASTLNHSLATYVRNDFIRNQFHYAPNKRPCLSTGVIRIFTLAMLNLLELPQVHDKYYLWGKHKNIERGDDLPVWAQLPICVVFRYKCPSVTKEQTYLRT